MHSSCVFNINKNVFYFFAYETEHESHQEDRTVHPALSYILRNRKSEFSRSDLAAIFDGIPDKITCSVWVQFVIMFASTVRWMCIVV